MCQGGRARRGVCLPEGCTGAGLALVLVLVRSAGPGWLLRGVPARSPGGPHAPALPHEGSVIRSPAKGTCGVTGWFNRTAAETRCPLNRAARRAVLQGDTGAAAGHLMPEGQRAWTGRRRVLISMTFTGFCRPRGARIGGVLAVTFLMILTGGCAAGRPPGLPGGPPSLPSAQPTAPAGRGRDVRALARRYLAIAVPANHRLDSEVDGFTSHERNDLAVAERDLRAEAATERWFD